MILHYKQFRYYLSENKSIKFSDNFQQIFWFAKFTPSGLNTEGEISPRPLSDMQTFLTYLLVL